MVQHSNRELLKHFSAEDLPDLDVVVLGALELFRDATLPSIDTQAFSHPLVIGSGNAAVTGRVIFKDSDAIYANESTYKKVPLTDAGEVVLISASGGKHAIEIAQFLKEKKITTTLLTNNPNAPAKEFLDERRIILFPKNREPYTYNVSTYLGMILAKTKENPQTIHAFCTKEVVESVPDNFSQYNAFFLIIPPQFETLSEMFQTKFDELFGPTIIGRIFTLEEAKHAKTVVPSERECFISFGESQDIFGTPEQRIHIPLPDGAGFGAMMAVGYYTIGNIQKQHPPYFKEHIQNYTVEASKIFNYNISVIVD